MLLMYRCDLYQSLLVPPWHRCLIWITELKVIRVAEGQLGIHLPVTLTLERREAMGDSVPDVLQSTTSSPSSSSVVQIGTLPNILDQWRSITSDRLVHNVVKGHHLQLRFILSNSIISNALTLRLL